MPCLSVCYAMGGHFRRDSVIDAHKRNLQLSGEPQFAAWMVAELAKHMVRCMRIHVAGDFYSERYIAAWKEIIKASSKTRFFTYTRSWRSPGLLGELLGFTTLPNIQLWWSVDHETGLPPQIPGVRTAYMAVDDADAERAPPHVDLIFRNNPRTIRKKINGIQVCPEEIGEPKLQNLTCSRCKICYTAGKSPPMAEVLSGYTACEITAPGLKAKRRKRRKVKTS